MHHLAVSGTCGSIKELSTLPRLRLSSQRVAAQRIAAYREEPAKKTQARKALPKTILLAVDESPESDNAVKWASKALLQGKDSLHLLSAVPPPLSLQVEAAMDEWHEQLELQERVLKQSAHLVERYSKLLDVEHEVALHAHILPTPAGFDKKSVGKIICEEAKKLRATVVVVASRSHGGLLEVIRGSVADYVVRRCESPVAILHRPRDGALQSNGAGKTAAGGTSTGNRILLAVDASEESEVAVRWVADHLYTPEDTVTLLHIVPFLPLTPPITGSDLMSEEALDPAIFLRLEEQAKEEATSWSNKEALPLRAILDEAGIKHEVRVVVQRTEDPAGSISSAICALADELGENAVVVVSYHHKSPLWELFSGNISKSVAHHCTRPVIVLPGSKVSTSSAI